MQWRNFLLALWRKAFPVRYVLVYRQKETNIPPAVNDEGVTLGLDDMLMDLQDAYSSCAPMFTWLLREIARKEREYHSPAPFEPGPRAVWQAQHETLNAQIAALNRAVRIPIIANMRIKQLKELAEQKKATAEELKVLEEYFME